MNKQEQKRKETALKLYNDLNGIMNNIYERWLDEKEYEDINEYAVLFQPKVEEVGGQFIGMTKKPFGFKYVLEDATYHVYVSGSTYGYKRIK